MTAKRKPFLDSIVSRTHISTVPHVRQEMLRLGFLRIAIGLVVTIRFAQLFWFNNQVAPEADWTRTISLLGVVLSALWTIGLCVPVTTIALVLVGHFIEAAFGCRTLGTNILDVTMLVMFMTNHGTRLSLDEAILKRWGRPVIRWQYRIVGDKSGSQLRQVYFLGFAAYALMSFAALLVHAKDPFWVSGQTSTCLLSNSFLCKYWPFFRQLETSFPWLARTSGIAGSIFQSAFQLLMIPLVFSRWGTRFVIAYGAFFFGVSLFLIQLSYLPYIEFGLWTMIFARSKGPEEAGEASRVEPGLISHFVQRRVVILFLLAYVVLKFPGLDRASHGVLTRIHPAIYEKLNHVLEVVGMTRPDVFNHVDLKMGDRWAVLYSVQGDEREIVPITGSAGERLNYQGVDFLFYSNHNSDCLSFGNTLKYRRWSIGRSVREQHSGDTFADSLLKNRAIFDYAYRGRSGDFVAQQN